MKYQNRLRILRAQVPGRQRAISQYELAFRTDIKLYRYWRIEQGYVEATPAEKKRLAKALKATVEDAWPESQAVAS